MSHRSATIRPTVSALALAAFLPTAPCHAQSAHITVAHNDPDGIVAPGETVRITATVSWQNAPLFWWINGGVAATPDIGTAANPAFGVANPYTNAATIIDSGSPSAGSIDGVEVFSAHLIHLQNPAWVFEP